MAKGGPDKSEITLGQATQILDQQMHNLRVAQASLIAALDRSALLPGQENEELLRLAHDLGTGHLTHQPLSQSVARYLDLASKKLGELFPGMNPEDIQGFMVLGLVAGQVDVAPGDNVINGEYKKNSVLIDEEDKFWRTHPIAEEFITSLNWESKNGDKYIRLSDFRKKLPDLFILKPGKPGGKRNNINNFINYQLKQFRSRHPDFIVQSENGGSVSEVQAKALLFNWRNLADNAKAGYQLNTGQLSIEQPVKKNSRGRSLGKKK